MPLGGMPYKVTCAYRKRLACMSTVGVEPLENETGTFEKQTHLPPCPDAVCKLPSGCCCISSRSCNSIHAGTMIPTRRCEARLNIMFGRSAVMMSPNTTAVSAAWMVRTTSQLASCAIQHMKDSCKNDGQFTRNSNRWGWSEHETMTDGPGCSVQQRTQTQHISEIS